MSARRPTFLPYSLPICMAVLLAGCAVGPDDHRPSAPVPATYKEAAGWKPAAPGDATERGAWWAVFHDPVLDDLEQQAAEANQTLAQAVANYEAARQLARADHATLWPTLSLSGSGQRAKAGGGRTSSSVSSGTGGTTSVSSSSGKPTNSFSASLGASWTPDFWGRVRRQTEADVATAQASAADLATARLSMQSSLAQDYLDLRIADERIRLRQNAVEAYRRTLAIAENKYKVGIAARSDVISAQAQLDAARAQVIDASVQRAQLEHAIAVLVGKAPGGFTLTPLPVLASTVPSVPAQLPAELLERRPDIASAERAVAAANARVGVQKSAYFPTVSLSADGGYEGSVIRQLFNAPNRFWSVGGNLADTLFDFGRRGAEMAQVRAAYEGSVAGYRSATLRAFQEVEDNLSSLRLLEEEAKVQDAAVTEASDAARIALNEYNAGTVDFTTVVTAQVNELTDRQTALTILQGRLAAAVGLIQAIGGGWSTSDLPASSQVFARDAANSSAPAR